MKAVILAGGLGSRISEESYLRPKPMIEIGGKPILWHIMKMYSAHGINEFVVCCGYKGYVIKEYFANYFLHQSDVTIDLANNSIEVHHKKEVTNWERIYQVIREELLPEIDMLECLCPDCHDALTYNGVDNGTSA